MPSHPTPFSRSEAASARDLRPEDDPCFIPAGAEAFGKDLLDARVTFLDTRHFATETPVVEIAAAMTEFLAPGFWPR